MSKQRTQKSGPHDATRILVDYFCFTISVSEFFDHDITDEKAVYTADRIERKFMLRGLEFQERKGMYGYAYARWYDGIVYAWGGNNTIYRHRLPHLGDHAPRPGLGTVDKTTAIHLCHTAYKPYRHCLRYLRHA